MTIGVQPYRLAVALMPGLLATFLAVAYLPWMLYVGYSKYPITGSMSNWITAVAIVASAFFAITQYWYLAIQTANNQIFLIGPRFYAGLVGGVIASLLLIAVAPLMFLLAVPAWVAGGYFLRIQTELERGTE